MALAIQAGDRVMLIENFRQLAAYNRWANARLYAAALILPDDDYRRHVGVFFGSLHATLNHLLVADRIWLRRLTGAGDAPNTLNAILFEDRADLTRARIAEDDRISALIDSYDDARLMAKFSYRTMAGEPHEQMLNNVLMHLFNHQTHHRGQGHACYSIVTGEEPPVLDLLAFQRGLGAPDLLSLAGRP